MKLDESQRKQVVAWISEGLKLSEIQNRIASELSIRMTYMDVRLLVDDLRLIPKDENAPTTAARLSVKSSSIPYSSKPDASQALPSNDKTASGPSQIGQVTVGVDQIAKPGTVVSGKVTFTDGNKAEWHLDETGRLGLLPEQSGYHPSAGDLQQFQAALEKELSKSGLY